MGCTGASVPALDLSTHENNCIQARHKRRPRGVQEATLQAERSLPARRAEVAEKEKAVAALERDVAAATAAAAAAKPVARGGVAAGDW